MTERWLYGSFTFPISYQKLNTHSWSKDGTLYAYALSQSGSDWCYAKVRNVASGEDFSEKIEWLKFTGLSFTHDNNGFFYQRLPEPVGIEDAGTETGANKNAMVKQMRNFSEELVLLSRSWDRPVRRYLDSLG